MSLACCRSCCRAWAQNYQLWLVEVWCHPNDWKICQVLEQLPAKRSILFRQLFTSFFWKCWLSEDNQWSVITVWKSVNHTDLFPMLIRTCQFVSSVFTWTFNFMTHMLCDNTFSSCSHLNKYYLLHCFNVC